MKLFVTGDLSPFEVRTVKQIWEIGWSGHMAGVDERARADGKKVTEPLMEDINVALEEASMLDNYSQREEYLEILGIINMSMRDIMLEEPVMFI